MSRDETMGTRPDTPEIIAEREKLAPYVKHMVPTKGSLSERFKAAQPTDSLSEARALNADNHFCPACGGVGYTVHEVGDDYGGSYAEQQQCQWCDEFERATVALLDARDEQVALEQHEATLRDVLLSLCDGIRCCFNEPVDDDQNNATKDRVQGLCERLSSTASPLPHRQHRRKTMPTAINAATEAE